MTNEEKLESLKNIFIRSLEGENSSEIIKNKLDIIIKIKTIQSMNATTEMIKK